MKYGSFMSPNLHWHQTNPNAQSSQIYVVDGFLAIYKSNAIKTAKNNRFGLPKNKY